MQTALDTGIKNVIVVLGANSEKFLQHLPLSQVQVVQNLGWAEGMASSIRLGLAELQKVAPQITQVLFMLCDQPFVTAALLNELVQKKEETKKKIVACSYADTLGAPVLFDLAFFPELLQLKGQEGAKKILSKHPVDIAPLFFPLGVVDIDTPSDYTFLIQKANAID